MKVVITGASGGIGSAIAREFAKKGDNVALLFNKSQDKALQLAKELSIFGGMIIAEKADFCDSNQVLKTFERIEKAFGYIDILINCAGISHCGLLQDLSEKSWDEIFTINVKSAFLSSKWAIPLMRINGFGRIINISSIWGCRGAACEVAYAASKSALEGFTRSLAAEVGGNNITVNAIAAGMIDTQMNSIYTKEEKTQFVKELPISRLGTAKEVAAAVLYLSSDDAAYITGATVPVSGGF